jgi:hypothetical protein
MGYGANACWADVISKEDIIKVVGKTAEDFFNSLTEDELENFAKFMVYDIDFMQSDKTEQTLILYNRMRDDFEEKTKLELEIMYHDSEEGDRYDDVEGVFFDVVGVFDVTPEARKLLDSGIEIRRAGYVIYG